MKLVFIIKTIIYLTLAEHALAGAIDPLQQILIGVEQDLECLGLNRVEQAFFLKNSAMISRQINHEKIEKTLEEVSKNTKNRPGYFLAHIFYLKARGRLEEAEHVSRRMAQAFTNQNQSQERVPRNNP